MTKIEKDGCGTVSMWTLNQKISGLVFVTPNIPALKYCRDKEIEEANIFIEFIKGKHTDIKLSDCGLFVDETLPYVGVSPDRILQCSCCEKACVEIKCPYWIDYTKPSYSNLEYLRLCDGKTLFNKYHKYYTQSKLQMAVTETIKIILLFGLPMEWFLMRYILIMNSGVQLKINSKTITSIFFKVFFQWTESCFYLGTLLFVIKTFEA